VQVPSTSGASGLGEMGEQSSAARADRPTAYAVVTASSVLGILLCIAVWPQRLALPSARAALVGVNGSLNLDAWKAAQSRELLSCDSVVNWHDCGFPGIKKNACQKKGCCWRPGPLDGRPWCFKRFDDTPPQCRIRSEDKEECGFLHITKDECLHSAECCYAPTHQHGVPFCYKKRLQRKRQIKIACVGASITAGTLNVYTSYSYPVKLQEYLGQDFYVANFGHNGATVSEAGLHHQTKTSSSYFKTQEFEDALNFEPDVVVSQFVDNDSREDNWVGDAEGNFVHDYSKLVDSFANLTSKPTFLIMRPPPLYVDGRYGMNKTVSNKVIPGLLERIRKLKNLPPIVDVYSAFDEHCPVATNTRTNHNCTWIATDEHLAVRPGFEGVHPTTEGNKAMAKVVALAVRQNMPRATNHKEVAAPADDGIATRRGNLSTGAAPSLLASFKE